MEIDTNRLAGMYTRAFILMRCAPETASPRKKRRVRKKLNRENRELRLHPLLSELDDDAFFRALREADIRRDREAEKQGQALKELLSDFSPKVQEALTRCLDGTTPSYLIRNGQETEIRLFYGAFRCRLLLQDAKANLSDGKPVYVFSLRREGERFRMNYAESGEEGEPENPSALTFSGIKAVIEPFDCSRREADQNLPWELLLHAAMDILEKAESTLAKESCNPEELALLPLLEEVFRLFLSECGAYPLLRELAASHGLSAMEKLLTAMETCSAKRARRYARKISSLLCDHRCEPLWREVYGRIRASQAGYPLLTELECSADTLADVRKQVQTQMKAHGYEGTYPDFAKINEKKRTISRVHYIESVLCPDMLKLQYVSGTGKAGETTDMDSCLFRGRGRRHRTGRIFIPFEEAKKELLAQCVGVAVKQAEKKRLTTEEVRLSGGIPHRWAWTLLYLSIFFGAGIPVILALFLLVWLVFGAILGQEGLLSELFADSVWWTTSLAVWALCSLGSWLYLVWKSKR